MKTLLIVFLSLYAASSLACTSYSEDNLNNGAWVQGVVTRVGASAGQTPRSALYFDVATVNQYNYPSYSETCFYVSYVDPGLRGLIVPSIIGLNVSASADVIKANK